VADTNFLPGLGDSVRIHASPGGGLTDLPGNGPERLARWAPIRFGEVPVRIAVEVPSPLLVDRGQIPANHEPPVSLQVRRSEADGTWNPLPGGPSLTRPLRDYVGIVVTLNRIPDEGGLYVYDRLGVAVTRIDFAPVREAARAGLLERTSRGEFQILLAWNGRDDRGHDVASGVYLARIYGWLRDGSRHDAVNVVRRVGVRRPLPDNF
jgi:hypothetical protein